ncbi:hypothetical protein EVAR_45454_1 [Eumeta japonica]|uniref:Uncharacterized protein n=1 Tax=Eumeta variegata TaxID=151549 RepID=A0A4C1YJU4_EUMVA|nr:hypothetical protein EVAR_45454_1 [Eumeta japonica]
MGRAVGLASDILVESGYFSGRLFGSSDWSASYETVGNVRRRRQVSEASRRGSLNIIVHTWTIISASPLGCSISPSTDDDSKRTFLLPVRALYGTVRVVRGDIGKTDAGGALTAD